MRRREPQGTDQRLSTYHARTRARGVNPLVYWLVRAVVQPAIRLLFRPRRSGRCHIPDGAVILAANHRSFLDPFVIGCALRRPVYFVAKAEMFEHRLLAWLLSSLGAFPVRRGHSDADTTRTALELLAGGAAVVIFPEGTRVRTGSLGRPKRGVGRLALASGAPVVPVALTGTERARRGVVVRPVRVDVRFGRPLTFPRVESPSPALAKAVTDRIWPCVELGWEWLGGLPPLRTAAVVGGGAMGTAAAVLLARAGLEVQLGCRTRAQAKLLSSARENERGLPGVALDPAIEVRGPAELELCGADLVVLAVPCAALPATVARLGAQVSERSGVLVLARGPVPPLGMAADAYVAERVRARGVASLLGPGRPREAVERGTPVVLVGADRQLRRQLEDVMARAGLRAHSTADVVGAQTWLRSPAGRRAA